MSDSFGEWLLTRVCSVLGRATAEPPFLLWCDPRREWPELLKAAAAKGGFDLWMPDGDSPAHELLLRDRFLREDRAPRVIWLPRAREDVTWFKVFEPEAEAVWEQRLIESLRDYGVRIEYDQEREVEPLLPSYVREWFDRPKSTWKDFTPGQAKGALVDDERMLQALAGPSGEFDLLRAEERFDVFARRCVEDFGLPRPAADEEDWRVGATARLLATEAAHGCPATPPREGEYVIPAGAARDNALRLLRSWQNHVEYLGSFERLSGRADARLGLAIWARNLASPPRSFASRAVEDALFRQAVDRLDRIEDVFALARELERQSEVFQDRQRSFWGRHASEPVGWGALVSLAQCASIISECVDIGATWKAVKDAVQWYATRGWQLDQAGSTLYLENPGYPGELTRIRARLRRAFLRTTDAAGRAFSDLLESCTKDLDDIRFSGEVALEELGSDPSVPTALFIVDACRMELGQRLAALLNEGEPVTRATVRVARSPVPTITAIGMPFALPMRSTALHVAWECKDVRVTADGFDGDLSQAAARRKWLAERLDVRDFHSVADVLTGDKVKAPSRGRRLIVVNGAEFDHEGHDGRLLLSGAEDGIERYAVAIRRLRSLGYNRVIVVTDHGFFHWQPGEGEIEDQDVRGDVAAVFRRAALGTDLKHKTAIRLKVPSSDLEVAVPRSVSCFKAYGGLGYFHGGATLQEMIVPVIVARWPAKAGKVPVVLKPVEVLASESPRVQVAAALTGQAGLFADAGLLARRVLVKVRDAALGKLVFRHDDAVTLNPGSVEPLTVQLRLTEPRPRVAFGTTLLVEVRDADDEELLAQEQATLKVDIDEW